MGVNKQCLVILKYVDIVNPMGKTQKYFGDYNIFPTDTWLIGTR